MILEKHTNLIADSIPNAKVAFGEGDHFIANKNSSVFNEKVLHFSKH